MLKPGCDIWRVADYAVALDLLGRPDIPHQHPAGFNPHAGCHGGEARVRLRLPRQFPANFQGAADRHLGIFPDRARPADQGEDSIADNARDVTVMPLHLLENDLPVRREKSGELLRVHIVLMGRRIDHIAEQDR
jgi:hypothetical protein